MRNAANRIRVLVAADVRFYREGLAQGLGAQDDIVVLGTVADGDEMLERVREIAPDIVLLDVAMPETLALVRTLSRNVPPVRVVGIAIPEVDEDVIACAEAGMHGYVPREASLEDLLASLRSVAAGELLCSPRIAATLQRRVTALASAWRPEAPLARLTARELEIVQLIDKGLSNKEIARTLFIEVSTVKNHVHHILEKLGVRRRGQAAARMRSRPWSSRTLRTGRS